MLLDYYCYSVNFNKTINAIAITKLNFGCMKLKREYCIIEDASLVKVRKHY